MPDKGEKIWRKKIYKPKEFPPSLRGDGGDDTTSIEDPNERRRHHGWRKTMHGSRPQTPVSATMPINATDDIEDARSERSETSTPRRDSKPKLGRYTSLFTSFKESTKGPEFAAPWSENAPLPFQSYVDPLEAVQSTRSHMSRASSKPIPVEHNSGLFRIFEDYGIVRKEKERLSTLLQETFQSWRKAEEQWAESEGQYETEIRRLELVIARGTSGMAGLMKARQGSVMKRRQSHRMSLSSDRLPPTYDLLSPSQLDHELKLSSQRVLLHRPVSPSGKMAALSKQLAGAVVDMRIGTPPAEDMKMTLSRQMQSDLNLVDLGRIDAFQAVPDSAMSDSSCSVGDPLPDEILVRSPVIISSHVEYDALNSLRELGTLVARKRGLKVARFVDGLMQLLSTAEDANDVDENIEKQTPQLVVLERDFSEVKLSLDESVSPRRTLRRFQSQPQLASDQRRRRHFSFEPGDDQLEALREEHETFEGKWQHSDSTRSKTPPPSHSCSLMFRPPCAQTPSADVAKPSKIPSPVQTFGRNERRDSRSSILTVFREGSNGSLRPYSTSRSNSIHNLRATDTSLQVKHNPGGVQLGNSGVALAAARAVSEKTSQTSTPRGRSRTRSEAQLFTASSSHMSRKAGPWKLENIEPEGQ